MVVVLAVLCLPLFSVFVGGSVSAESFSKNKIISDAVMDDHYTMTASQIDAFLNSKGGGCISPNSGFKAINPIGYNQDDGYLYGGPVTAGTVIYNAAKAYEINPRVLLTTMQKEQSLVTSASCSTNTLAKSMGYGCPDSYTQHKYSGLNLYYRNGTKYTSTTGDGICVNSAEKAGFTQQVIRAAWMLKYSRMRAEGKIDWAIIKGDWDNSDDLNATYSGYMTEGCFKRSKYDTKCTDYDGYATIDKTSVHMDNGATAALYRYTPHFSGNTHFVEIFSGWFGSVYSSEAGDAIIDISNRYAALGGNVGALGDLVSDLKHDNSHVYWQKYVNGYIMWSASTGAWESTDPIRDRWEALGYQTSELALPTGSVKPTTDGSYQRYQGGYIIGKDGTGYWESKGSIRNYWASLGYQISALGYPTGPERKISDGGYYQKYEDGYIIGRHDVGYWESKGPIRTYWASLGYQAGEMGYPTAAIVTQGAVSWQHYQAGVIIGSSGTGYWESKGSIRNVWAQLDFQTGALGLPTGPETYSNGIWSQTYEHGVIQTRHGVKYKVTYTS
jgi:hypothetical protein